jgi:hypothetical protein
MADVGDVGSDRCVYAKFFVQFARKSLFGTLTLFDFSAGKLPLQSHGLIGAALADQDKAVAHQQSRNDEAKCGSRRARVGDGLRVFHASSVNGQ